MTSNGIMINYFWVQIPRQIPRGFDAGQLVACDSPGGALEHHNEQFAYLYNLCRVLNIY